MHPFETFVCQYQDMVFSTAMRITGDRRDGQDIAQQVFIKAWEQFDMVSNHENPGGWLRLTARNLGINVLVRNTKRWDFFGSSDELPQEQAHNVHDEWLYSGAQELRDQLAKLPDRFRGPLVLHYYEEMEYEQVAQALNCSVGKVKSDIFRGKELLRKRCNKEVQRGAL